MPKGTESCLCLLTFSLVVEAHYLCSLGELMPFLLSVSPCPLLTLLQFLIFEGPYKLPLIHAALSLL